MSQEVKDIKAIFSEALEKQTDDERSSYLGQACGNDADLREKVENLLKAHNEAGDFLEPPDLDAEAGMDLPPTERPGTVIGRYKLLEQIGEGGMAVVYMADQYEPIRRKVALKIIKLGMDTKSVIARFEAERQALAMMDHPNVAKVLDAGATETGRPYFVMELVRGVSITEFCDKNNLSTRERLELFISVCQAVQHAHQKGIIHRDIKPTNVMVTQHEGTPVPKVIDFGIAKAINQRLTEKTLFTRYAHMIGTPAYMSPEQAELSDIDIDTRSDIYSLGVLLYELLTGTPPFSEDELRKAGYIEMQRIILEEEPTRPSTKLSTLGETLTEIAKHRASTPDLLRKAVRGDLDWIVMKSLEKARERRYDKASALALDIQRHLKDQPILARAPGTFYRLHKFFRRHRFQVAASLIVSVLAVTLLIVVFSDGKFDELPPSEREAFFTHRSTLRRATDLFKKGNHDAAWANLVPILYSKHVGSEARRLSDQILAELREHVRSLTEEIKTNPEDARNYLYRAQRYCCLGETANMIADMEMYVNILIPLDETNPYDLWFREFLRGLWQSTPTNLGPTVNSWTLDSTPSISADGRSLYFSSTRSGGPADLWVTTRATVSDRWDPPVKLGPPVNSAYTDDTPSISYDGLTLYFSSWRPGGHGKMDIWKATRQTTENEWGAPVNLGPTINSSVLDWSPSISADGLLLVFCSNRPDGIVKTDLWMTRRSTTDDPWSEPVNLGPPVNSPDVEATPSISSDGLLLFFQSTRPGGYGGPVDIWVARRKTTDDPWSEPVNLGPVINTFGFDGLPSISADRSALYFVSNRPGGHGDEDLWQVSITPMSGDFRDDRDSDSVPESVKSNGGKEG